MKTKAYLLLLLLLCLSLCLAACGTPTTTPSPDGDSNGAVDSNDNANNDGQQITMKISLSVPKDHESYRRVEEFAAAVNAETNNAFKFELYPSDQLGDYTVVAEELVRGNVEMVVGSIGTTMDPRNALIFTPYLTNTYDEVTEVFSAGSFVYDTTAQILDELGIVLLGIDVIGSAGLAMASKCPDDPYEIGAGGNLLVRVPANEHNRIVVAEMGYSPMTVNWSEVYSSLQTGVIDGFVGANASTAYLQFRDVIKYFVPIDIWLDTQNVCISKVVWDTLTPEQQASLQKNANELFQKSVEQTAASDGEYLRMLEESGVNVIYPQEGDLEALAAMAREKAWPALGAVLGDELYNELAEAYGVAQ